MLSLGAAASLDVCRTEQELWARVRFIGVMEFYNLLISLRYAVVDMRARAEWEEGPRIDMAQPYWPHCREATAGASGPGGGGWHDVLGFEDPRRLLLYATSMPPHLNDQCRGGTDEQRKGPVEMVVPSTTTRERAMMVTSPAQHRHMDDFLAHALFDGHEVREVLLLEGGLAAFTARYAFLTADGTALHPDRGCHFYPSHIWDFSSQLRQCYPTDHGQPGDPQHLLLHHHHHHTRDGKQVEEKEEVEEEDKDKGAPLGERGCGLFLGSKFSSRDRKALEDLHISHILNVTWEVDNEFEDSTHFVYHRCVVADKESEDIARYFEESWRFIDDAFRHGGSVLVHCAQGVSRSATIVVSYLVGVCRWRLAAAYAHVQRHREVVAINPGFYQQLLQLDARLHDA